MSLKSKLREIIEQERGPILEAAQIPEEERPEIIRVWLDYANKIEVDEALQGGSNTLDECRTLALFACGMASESAAKYLQNRFWEGMSWRVDEAIEQAREDIRSERQTREQEQAEWRLEEMRGAS